MYTTFQYNPVFFFFNPDEDGFQSTKRTREDAGLLILSPFPTMQNPSCQWT